MSGCNKQTGMNKAANATEGLAGDRHAAASG
jgi:hypothetical protein